MKGESVVFSAESDLWRTERALVAWLTRTYGPFDLDAAASDNLIAPRWFGPGSPSGEDALVVPWDGRVFLNMPYSQAKPFVAKSVEELVYNTECVSLTVVAAARTDTGWFQSAWSHWTKVDFLKSRTRFWLSEAEAAAINGARAAAGKLPISDQNTAPFPSVILHWNRYANYVGPHVRCVDWRAELTQ